MPVADQTWANIVAHAVGHDDPAIMSDASVNRGRPTFRDTHIPIHRIIDAAVEGSYQELKEEYPEFAPEMVHQCLEGLARFFKA